MTLPACLIPTAPTDLALVEARALRPGDVIVCGGELLELDDVINYGISVHVVYRDGELFRTYMVLPHQLLVRAGHLEGLRAC